MMRHFSLEEWLDYNNGFVRQDKQTFMERHLEGGCSHCTSIIANWRLLKQFAVQEPENDVPEEAVAFAKRAFNTRPQPESRGFLAVFADLVFDSFRQPILAGTRKGSLGSRCLLYEAGPVLIDLNLDMIADTGHIALQGQVLDSLTKARGVKEIPVLLQSGQETIARTQTNEFGEFVIECDSRKSMQLSVEVNQQKNVLIVLDDSVLTARQEVGNPH